MPKNFSLGLMACFLVFSWPAQTFIYFEDATQPELITSARALGLGNAYLAKVDDSSAAFYNPAGLGTVRHFRAHLSSLHLEVNKGFLTSSTEASVTDTPSRFQTSVKPEKAREILEGKRNQLLVSRLHLAPNLTARHFSLGFLYAHQLRGLIRSAENAPFEFSRRIDQGPYLALNLSLFGGVMKIGATGVYLTRKEIFREIRATEAFNLSDSDYDTGRTFYLIGGWRLTLPFRALPTFALKLNNMSGGSFKRKSSAARAPSRIEPSWDGGFSLTPQVGRTVRLHFELGYRDLTSQHELRTSRRLAGGIEVDLKRIGFLRFGYGDGFGSMGIGLRTQSLELDLTSYAVDRAPSGFRGEEDRRYVFSLSSSL